MKRTAVDADESLLEEARKVTDETSPGAIVDKALEELVRVAKLKRGIQAIQSTKDIYSEKYLAEIRPNSWAGVELRRALYEGREPEFDPIGDRTR